MKILVFAFFLLMANATNGQTMITLVNDTANDRDALVGTKTGVNEDNANYKKSPDVGCGKWTYGSAGTGINRCFLNFDWSRIPAGATITSAKLNLYAVPAGWIILGGHQGSNESYLKRVTGAWDPSTVTWNNQPATTDSFAVTLAQSTSSTQNYLNIDVTGMVKGMQMSGSWGGFAFISKNEAVNGVLSFASSNYSDSTKRPSLVVTYANPDAVISPGTMSSPFSTISNPSENPLLRLNSVSGSVVKLQLYSVTGQLLGEAEFSGSEDISLHQIL